MIENFIFLRTKDRCIVKRSSAWRDRTEKTPIEATIASRKSAFILDEWLEISLMVVK